MSKLCCWCGRLATGEAIAGRQRDPACDRHQRIWTRRARFWVYLNGGPVKLTLRVGQELHWGHAETTDEGWSYEQEVWWFDGEHVHREATSSGKDCDGRLDRYSQSLCPLSQLMDGNEPYLTDSEAANPLTAPYWEGVVWPNWQEVVAGQRDHQAEMAGY